MNQIKTQAFTRLHDIATQADRHRDDQVVSIRDCITILGTDLDDEIKDAFEEYATALNRLRGVRLLIDQNKFDIEKKESQ